MKGLIICVALVILSSVIYCQTAPYWQWASSATVASANDALQSKAIATDSMGNCYTVGSFRGIATFGSFVINSISDQTSDIYVAKLDSAGGYIWAVRAGGSFDDSGNDIAIDGSGNIYVTGNYRGIAAFGDILLTSACPPNPVWGTPYYQNDIFVAKMDNNGNWIWVTSTVSTNGRAVGNGIDIDDDSNVYVTGRFGETVNFGTTPLTISGGQYDYDAFVAKLDSNGCWLWARKAGGLSYEEGLDIVIDIESNVVITGYFDATCSFGSYSLVCTSNGWWDIFVAKLDTSGNWLWASQAGSPERSDYVFSLETDAAANIYLTGYSETNATFGYITASLSTLFIAKLNSIGAWIWVKPIPGHWNNNRDNRNNIAIDSESNIYVTGIYQEEQASFDEITIHNPGRINAYIAKLDNNGNWIWVKPTQNHSQDIEIVSPSISVDDYGDVYLTGSYNGSVYFGNVNLQQLGTFVSMLNMTPQSEIILSSYNIDFGTKKSITDTEQNVTISNIGAVTGDITDITITGSTFFSAEVISRNPILLPFSLTAGDSVMFTIHYLPEQMGLHEAVLNITIDNHWVFPIPLKGYLSNFIDSGIVLPIIEMGNSNVWGDYDSDGDLDIYNSGMIIRNDGNDVFTEVPTGLPLGGYVGSWGDFDNDGDLDLVIIGNTGMEDICRVYRNEGNSNFIDINAGLIGGSNGSAKWGDYDNDGDIDILVTGGGITRIYINNGNSSFTDINAAFNSGDPLTYFSSYKANWSDIDNDGDLDIFITGQEFLTGNWSSSSRVYRNDGNHVFTYVNAGLTGVGRGETTFGDYDNDGDLDVLQTGLGSDYIWTIYRNDGDFVFSEISSGLAGTSSSSAWGDYDNDGDLDVLLNGTDEFVVYRNDGNGVFTDIEAGLSGVYGGSTVWGDYDNDGDLDIMLSVALDNLTEYNTKIYRNEISNSNQSPTPPQINYEYSNGFALLADGSSDDTTPIGALHYNYRIGSTPGGCEIVSPMALGNGLRELCSYGNSYSGKYFLQDFTPDTTIYVSAQALDNSFSGSAFSPEVQVTTPTLEITYPNGGELLQAGSLSTIQWAGNSVKELYLKLSSDNGTNWEEITALPVLSDTGVYQYSVPNLVLSQCLVKIAWVKDSNYFDVSDSTFSISNQVEPHGVISASQLTFGNVWVNHTATKNFAISNQGLMPMDVTLFLSSGAFTVSTSTREGIDLRNSMLSRQNLSSERNEINLSIPAMSTQTIYVSFLPTALQSYTRNLFIETNADNLPSVTIPISGTGYNFFAEFQA
ncbi:MAG: hypothetical protein CVU50_10665, partial [Candidatus Cloacimonetes bacterium HGW-Cloacimonetes-3]